ncbi:hypothetical protein WJX72_006218 [[Myrmecia] bisecta]|uniref:DDRGK domain-containing protein 1 n=1 Tax=[Myrmecia] bisecta TaxID=41462 RepID=A0AAW1QFJ3_9CHLO
MEQTTVALAAVAVLVLLMALAVLAMWKLSRADQAASPAPTPAQPDAAARRRPVNRMAAGVRRRRTAAAAAAASAPASGSVADGEQSSQDGSSDEGEQLQQQMTRKEAKRAAREEERAAQEAARQNREQRQDSYAARRFQKDAEREAREAAQEAEMQRAEEERLKAEEEEAAKWMGMISVEQEGTGEAEVQEESQGMLQSFIDYMKERKTVVLEDLAAEFGLRVQDVINRVQSLEAMGRITGVMDDRGKFIYISPEEMEAVADFIKTRGRVAISELAAKSSSFIDLEAKAVQLPAGAVPDLDFDLDDSTSHVAKEGLVVA